MPARNPAAAALLVMHLVISAFAAQPLPELRIEAAAGGSILYIRNGAEQPLTAYLIELVDYPGSSYALWQDDAAATPIGAGAEKRIPITNMTVGAAPDYVKVRAALYADGSSSGIPEKVAQLIERRRGLLETTRELIRRIEKAQSSGTAKDTAIADLDQWANGLPPPGKSNRNSQAAINQAAARGLITDSAAHLRAHSVEETLAGLRASERALLASKPVL
jgi:hypothetical protein